MKVGSWNSWTGLLPLTLPASYHTSIIYPWERKASHFCLSMFRGTSWHMNGVLERLLIRGRFCRLFFLSSFLHSFLVSMHGGCTVQTFCRYTEAHAYISCYGVRRYSMSHCCWVIYVTSRQASWRARHKELRSRPSR